jgi:uncharacterized protein YciI
MHQDHTTMRRLSILSLFIIFCACNPKVSESDNPHFDAGLAEELGADDYGMKSYYLVMLKTPENEPNDTTLRAASFAGHMENMGTMVEAGKLVVAGPLGANEKAYRGLFIFQNIKDKEELKQLLETDPAIKNGFLDMEIYDWYGSAALPLYLEPSDKVWKVKP